MHTDMHTRTHGHALSPDAVLACLDRPHTLCVLTERMQCHFWAAHESDNHQFFGCLKTNPGWFLLAALNSWTSVLFNWASNKEEAHSVQQWFVRSAVPRRIKVCLSSHSLQIQCSVSTVLGLQLKMISFQRGFTWKMIYWGGKEKKQSDGMANLYTRPAGSSLVNPGQQINTWALKKNTYNITRLFPLGFGRKQSEYLALDITSFRNQTHDLRRSPGQLCSLHQTLPRSHQSTEPRCRACRLSSWPDLRCPQGAVPGPTCWTGWVHPQRPAWHQTGLRQCPLRGNRR